MADQPPPYLHTRLNKLSGFVSSFHEHLARVEQATHVSFDVDEFRLKCVYLDWVDVFEKSADLDDVDIWDYLDYLGGYGLYALLHHTPIQASAQQQENLVTAEARPTALVSLLGMELPDRSNSLTEVVRFWPEGFLAVSFCVSAIARVVERETGRRRTLDKNITDLEGFWWSFRENTTESPISAIAYFDVLLGNEPDWKDPFDFHARPRRSAPQAWITRR